MAEKVRKILIGSQPRQEVLAPAQDFIVINDYDFDEATEDHPDLSEVTRRCDDIDQATADYLLYLMDLEGCDIEDLGVTASMLSAIEDAFEETLANFGLFIYRPLFVKTDSGAEVFKYCQFEDVIGSTQT